MRSRVFPTMGVLVIADYEPALAGEMEAVGAFC